MGTTTQDRFADAAITRAGAVLGAYAHVSAMPTIESLLVDLRHYCASRGMAFGTLLVLSEEHYEAESKEAASC